MSIHRSVDYSQEIFSPLNPGILSVGFSEFCRKKPAVVESPELQEAAGTDDGTIQTGAEEYNKTRLACASDLIDFNRIIWARRLTC